MKFFGLIAVSLISFSSFSQAFNELVNAKVFTIESYKVDKLKENQMFISMPFAGETILNQSNQERLKEKAIVRVELVYTEFRSDPLFDQKELNRKRLHELKRLLPEVFKNPYWSFCLISQQQGKSKTECDKMFHGFILTFRPNSNQTSLNEEANYIENLVNKMVKEDSANLNINRKMEDIKTHYDRQVGYLHDTIWSTDTSKPIPPPEFFYEQSLYRDSTVLRAFNRNKSWNNLIIVIDVTGSMSPYISQVFAWLRNQIQKEKANYFVFFNDGDAKDSRKKKPMETRGIYHTKSQDLTSIMKTALKCMRKGSGGGERLENDIEAILEGIKNYPKGQEVVLVADNYESMRDYDYLKEIKLPVHVVLCGSENRINIQYMDLARQTGGSLHTSKSDITYLQEIKENEHFFIEEKEYVFKGGRFHSIYHLY